MSNKPNKTLAKIAAGNQPFDLKRRRILTAAAGIAALELFPTFASAATYPEKPVTIVVAYPPGGQNDVAGRIAAQALAGSLGQPVIVENRAGAGGIIGAQAVARAAPDGYTFLLAAINHSILTTLKAKMPYDLEKDFDPVGKVAAFPIILVTSPAQPFKTVQELIAFAKANPNKLTYGSSGNGGGTHLAAELFCSMAGVKMLHVPYKGSAPAMTDLLGGHVQLMFADSPTALPHIKTGKLRPLGISSRQRSALMPELPTIAESGVAGYESNSWVGLVAPHGTPDAVVNKVNAALVKALNDPAVKAKLLDIGGEPMPDKPEQFGQFIHSETKKWAKIIKDANIPLLD
ncbi:MAG: Bug family tripartite tricarboxylate transporter substrate binding protein [Noviherbaspirillum sp.]